MDLYPWSFDSIHSHCHDDMIIFLKEFLIIWVSRTSATRSDIMAPSACNQVMNDGSDLEGIRILFQDHLIPEFIPLSKVIQVNNNGVIDDITVIDPLFFGTSTKDIN
jgi:hypothetical protein